MFAELLTLRRRVQSGMDLPGFDTDIEQQSSAGTMPGWNHGVCRLLRQAGVADVGCGIPLSETPQAHFGLCPCRGM